MFRLPTYSLTRLLSISLPRFSLFSTQNATNPVAAYRPEYDKRQNIFTDIFQLINDLSAKKVGDKNEVFFNNLKRIMKKIDNENTLIRYLNSAVKVHLVDSDALKEVLIDHYSNTNPRINFWIIQNYCDNKELPKALEFKSSLPDDRLNYFFPLLNGYLEKGYDSEMEDLIKSTRPNENVFSNFEVIKGYIAAKNLPKLTEEFPNFLMQASENKNLIFTIYHHLATSFEYKEVKAIASQLIDQLDSRALNINLICCTYSLINKEKYPFVYALNSKLAYRASNEFYKVFLNHPKILQDPGLLKKCINLSFPPPVLNKIFKAVNKDNQQILKFLDSYLKEEQILEKYINFLTLEKNYNGLLDFVSSENGTDKFIYPFLINELRETGFDINQFIQDLAKHSDNQNSKDFFILQYLWFMSSPHYVTSVVTDFLLKENLIEKPLLSKVSASIIFRRINNPEYLRYVKRRIRKIQNCLPDELAEKFLSSLKESFTYYRSKMNPDDFLASTDQIDDEFFVHKPRTS